MFRNKDLWKGFLGGVLVAVLIGIIVLSGMKIGIFNGLAKNGSTDSAVQVVNDSGIQSKLTAIGKLIDEKYYEEVDVEKLETSIYKGLVNGLNDPYSAYYSESELQKLVDSLQGSYYGIGITMFQDEKSGLVEVVKVAENSPAKRAGVQEGDYIYKVNDEDITGTDISNIAANIRGEAGTMVRLLLIREGTGDYIDLEVERENIVSITVESEMLEDHIGYILLEGFETVTTSQFNNAYNQLLADGMEGLILDVRDNPGGQIDIVNEIAEKFLPKGIVTYIEDKNGNRQDYPCEGLNTFNKPLVVLVNGNSASASEILAGAVKDYDVGTLIGTTTYGKGIVQQTVNLGDGTALKLTFAKYYTPNGTNIHGIGIEPDIEVEINEEIYTQDYSKELDNQLQTGIQFIKEKMAQNP